MQKLSFLRKRLGLLFALVGGILTCILCSCADGYDSPNGFDAGVSNSQLENPKADSISFIVDASVTRATIKWPLVKGALGYVVTLKNVDDPDNPFVVEEYDEKMVDGLSITVPVTEDSKYSFDLKVIGDPDRGNKDAADVIHKDMSTLVPTFVTIPDGSDIATWLKEYVEQHPFPAYDAESPSYDEIAIELEPNGNYTMSEAFDFRTQKVTFRGDKIKWPIITMQGNATFQTCSGLKMKYLKFDCVESTATGLIGMSPSTDDNKLPDSLLVQNQGYTGSKLGKDFYVVKDPIYIADCWVKDLPSAIVYDNGTKCAWWYLTIKNCIIQQKNTAGKPFINFEKAGIAIKHISLTDNTLYNIVDAGTYWIRYSNRTSNQTVRVWGDKDATYKTSTTDVINCTLSKQFSKGKMANNNHGDNNILTFSRNIFYDCAMVRKWACSDQGNPTRYFSFNFWYAMTTPDTADPTQKDKDGNQFALNLNTEKVFEGSVLQSLDLSQPNGGVNFRPVDVMVRSNFAGDMRWILNQ